MYILKNQLQTANVTVFTLLIPLKNMVNIPVKGCEVFSLSCDHN